MKNNLTRSIATFEDHRKALIDIFFAVIITIGLERFLSGFLFPHLLELNSFNIPTLLNTFYAPSKLFNMFFFFAAYFWVISHWVFYHELIKKYPYYRCEKFFVDIALFSIMFVIINISFTAYSSGIFPFFILLCAIWYFFAFLWHWSDKGLRPLNRYLVRHVARLCIFLALLILAYDPFSLQVTYDWYRYVVMAGVILAIILCNLIRLKKFLVRDRMEYSGDYIEGCPQWSRKLKDVKISLVVYKRKNKSKIEKRNELIFESHNSGKINISAENVLGVDVVQRSGVLADENLVSTKIVYRYENNTIARAIFKINGEIINQLLAGMDELISTSRAKNGLQKVKIMTDK